MASRDRNKIWDISHFCRWLLIQGPQRLAPRSSGADCGERAPRWCSINLGVIICAECSSVPNFVLTVVVGNKGLDLNSPCRSKRVLHHIPAFVAQDQFGLGSRTSVTLSKRPLSPSPVTKAVILHSISSMWIFIDFVATYGWVDNPTLNPKNLAV